MNEYVKLTTIKCISASYTSHTTTKRSTLGSFLPNINPTMMDTMKSNAENTRLGTVDSDTPGSMTAQN